MRALAVRGDRHRAHFAFGQFDRHPHVIAIGTVGAGVGNAGGARSRVLARHRHVHLAA